MVKSLKLSLLAMAMIAGGSANAQYQLANSDFEEWESCTPYVSGKNKAPTVGQQPQGWKAANVAGYYLSFGIGGTWTGKTTVVTKDEKGYSGNAAKMANTNTLGNIIPGYMALGTPWNTANTSGGNADGGTFGGVALTSHPDALEFYYKRSLGKETNTQPASVVAYMWKGTATQTNVPANVAGSATKVTMTNRDANVLGREYALGDAPTFSYDFSLIATIGDVKKDAEVKINDTTDEWTKMVCPFTYHNDETPAMINIIFGAFENYAGKANNEDGNTFSVDNVKLLYYSELKSATFDGTKISFDEFGSASVDAKYEADKFQVSSNGKAATIVKDFDDKTQTLTITIKGENISEDASNYHTYTVKFAPDSEPADPKVVSSKTYTENLYVGINGMVLPAQEADVVVEKLDNNNINFILKNFVLGGAMPVGNINISNLSVANDNTFSYDDNLKIEKGDYESDWMGPDLPPIPLNLSGKFVGDEKVLVTIDIDLGDMFVNVHYGYDCASMSITSAKYATFCSQFKTEIPDGVKAYTCSSIDSESNLVLVECESVIPEKCPVIVETENEPYYDEDMEMYLPETYSFFGINDETTSATYGLLTGVYEETAAPQGSYVLQNQDGKVAFFKVASDDIMVGANRAYLNASASGAKVLNFSAEATAIKTIGALTSGKAEVYGANGARQNGLQKGMNIVKMADGSVQKVLVK